MTDVRITNAKSLPDLLRAMQEIEDECQEAGTDSEAVYDITSLPTFGGSKPLNTVKVWSWDETSLLVGDCVDEMKIQPRTWERS
jgi:hypothetical protein